MPRGVYQRRPKLQLVASNVDKKRKVREYKYPDRYIPNGETKALPCRIIQEWSYKHFWGDTDMVVIQLANVRSLPTQAEVDSFITVPKFRIVKRKGKG
jgi:hypothetical protein